MAQAISREELFKIDNLVLAALGVVALAFGYLSFSPPSLSVMEAKGEKVAEITTIESTVKRKSSEGLAWDAASEEDTLYGGDQIFTDKSSNAVVKFKDGSQIAVAENSLIKIEQKNGKTTIDMSKGFVSGKFADENANFAIKMGGTNVKLEKGAEIQVKIDPNNKGATKIALISGSAAVDSGGGDMALNKDQLLSVDSKGKTTIEEIDLKLVAPAQSEKFDDTATDSIIFKWDSSLKSATYTVSVAQDPQFKNIFFSKNTAGKSLSIPLPPGGTYYWRVGSTAANGKKDQSVDLQFIVNKLAPPELVSPIAGKRFQFEEGAGAPQMSFIWKSTTGAGGYEIEVASDSAFKNKIISQQVTSTSLDTKDLENGSYFWRVRAKSEATDKFGRFGIPAEFSLLKLSIPVPPKLLSPAPDTRVKPELALVFNWEESESADGYQFQLSRSKDFDSLALDKTVQTTSYSWNPDATGGFYWRVRSLDKFDRETKFSTARKLVIDASLPQLVLPENNAEITLVGKNMKMEFQWLQTPGAESYRIEISTDQSFKKSKIKKEIPTNEFKTESLETGIYFWRVKAALPGGAETAWSNARAFSLKELELLSPPALKDRYFFRLPPPLPGTAFIRQFFKLISLTETAFAQEEEVDASDTSKVSINWKPIESAEGYYVEIARDKSFSNIILKMTLSEPTFTWPEARAGRYWLRAASIDRLERKGKFSRLSEVIVSYRAPYLVEPQDNTIVTVNPGDNDVDFTWQFIKGGKYTLELSQKSNFSKMILTKQVNNNKYTATSLKDGTYYWRIRANYGDSLPAEASNTWSFTLQKKSLPAPGIDQPTAQTSIMAASATADVKINLNKVPLAEAYEVEFAKDAGFTKGKKKLMLSEPSGEVQLSTGNWYMRARAGIDKKNMGSFGEPVSFAVKKSLPAPIVLAPKEGEDLTLLGSGSRKVSLAWKQVSGSGNYEFEIAKDEDFNTVVDRQTQNDNKAETNLAEGTFYLRVRAIDAEGLPGLYSKVRSFDVEKKNLDAPALKFPDNGELLARRKAVKLQWKKESGYDGYKLVLSRDKNFKEIVTEKDLNKDSSTVKLPSTGEYYWYVEGKNKQNQYAMRSDVQTFTVSEYAESGGDRLRVTAGFAPSLISNTMSGDTINNSMSVTAFNSFMLNGQFWFTRSFGFEGAYHRKAADIFAESEDQGAGGGAGQSTFTYAPQHYQLNLTYRKAIGLGVVVPEIQARVGYMVKTFYSFYAQTRTTLSLQESSTQNLAVGIGAKYPFSLRQYVESWLDYGSTIASEPVTVSSGSHLMFDGRYYIMFPSRLNAGLGYRYANGVYQFQDDKNSLQGILEETTHSLIAALGYGF